MSSPTPIIHPHEFLNDPELLDIIGALRGTAIVEDEDDTPSEVDEDDQESDKPEISELSALEIFSQTLQKAQEIAQKVENERKRGPYKYPYPLGI